MKYKLLLLARVLLLSLIAVNCKNEIINPVETSHYQIVYTARDGRIYTMNGDGSNKTKFFNIGGFSPSFSPDGKKIVCLGAANITHEGWLLEYDIKNGTMKKIAYIKGVGTYSIDTYSWAPDVNKIAFNRAQNGLIQSDIFVVDLNTQEIKQLTSGPGYKFKPKWSPDQEEIFFTSFEDSMVVGYLMNADGSNIKPALNLPKGKVTSLDWSPDGEKILFLGPEEPLPLASKYDLYMSDSSGMNIRRLTFDGINGTGLWSPNGNLIVFSKGSEGGGDLYVMNPDGSNQRMITNNQNAILSTYLWCPDGGKILYLEDQGGVDSSGFNLFTIRVINPDGSNDIDTKAPLLFGFDCRVKY